MLALCGFIDRSIGHANTANDLDVMSRLAAEMNYTEEQMVRILQDVIHSYESDRGWGLLKAAFDD